MTSSPDISLPPCAPELGAYGDRNWDDASFAIYTLIDVTEDELQSIATTLDKEWMENQGNEGSHLVRVAPRYKFAGKSLENIVQAHIEMDKDETPRDDAAARGDLNWYPTAFLILTRRDWMERGLLFVYADIEKDDCPMDKFFFLPKDAYMMLSSISFGDEECARCKEIYEIKVDESTGGSSCPHY
ncbi:hypothetical protein LTR66_002841 [Elasticomyces elasticus]|nr:hypothetical protein LTR66_002841 [Elasticomyces elasticus]